MKKIFWVLTVLLAFSQVSFSQDDTYYQGNDQAYYDGNNNNYDGNYYNDQQYATADPYRAFYDGLQGYGYWVNNPEYGMVWVPTGVPADFSPYMTAGHWVYSDYGWTWVSDYSWGWAPFHYGRWFRDNYYGWMWMPGSEWAPAWVTWGSYNGYYCWAPVMPYVEVAYYRPQPSYWNYVPCANITQINLCNYSVSHSSYTYRNLTVVNNNITIINNGGSYNNHYYAAGPKSIDVERSVGHSIEHVSVTTASRPQLSHVSGGTMSIYRPEIKQSVNRTAISNRGFDRVSNQPTMQRQQTMRGNENMQRPNNNVQAFDRNNFHAQQLVQQQQMHETVRAENNIFNQQPVNRAQFNQQAFERNNVQNNMAQRQQQVTPPVQHNEVHSMPVQQPRSMQQFEQPVRQNVQMQQQRTFNQAPMQRQPERSFASVQQRSMPQQSFQGFRGRR